MADENVFQWVVRGVDRGLARRLVETAGARRLTVGELLNEVLREWGVSQDATRSPQDGRTVASGSEPKPDSRDELDAIRERLTALEEALAGGTTMPPQPKPARKRPSKHFQADSQAQPAPEAAVPGEPNREWFKPPAFKRLSDAGVAEVRRRFDAGEPDEDIARAVGLSQQAVNKHTKRWRSLAAD